MRSVAIELAIVGIFALVAALMTWPLLAQARTHIIDTGVDDTLLYTRYARCFRDWLLGREPGYLSFDMYFPSLLSGATDDAALGISVQALPLSFFIRDWLFTINLVTFASFVMCAHATYLLTREITKSRGAGIVAGLAFAFCFYRMRQLEHPHVMQMQWLPYALTFMHRLAKEPSRKNGVLFTLFLIFALTASFNVAIYSTLVFPIVGAWLVATTRTHRVRLIAWLAAACAMAGIACFFAYRPFFILRDAGAPLREAWEIKMFSSKLESFHAAPKFSIEYGHLAKNMSDECATFLGWVVLALGSIGLFGLVPKARTPLVSRRFEWLFVPFGAARASALTAALVVFAFTAIFDEWSRHLLVLGLASAIVFAIARAILHPTRAQSSPAPVYMGIALLYAACCFGLEVASKSQSYGHGIWQDLQRLPGFEQVRTPSRFFLVSSMCAAVLAGMGARAIAFAFPGNLARFSIFAIASASVLYDVRTERLPTRAMPTVATAPPVYAALASAPKPGAVLEIPVEWNQRQRLFVYYANIHGRPEVNGVSGWGEYYFNTLDGGSWERPIPRGGTTYGLESFHAAHIAGLRYVVIHGGWGVTDHYRELYVSTMTEMGGHRVGEYGGDELWELPDPPASRPLRLGDLDLSFQSIEWREKENRDTFVTIDFINRTSDAIYDGEKMKHFALEASAAGTTVGEGNVYLLPPLFTPHGDFQARFRMKLAGHTHADWVTVTVKDDDGHEWGRATMKLP